MFHSLSTVSGALALFLSASLVASKTQRGLAWATDNNYAPALGNKEHITWYHHWADPVVPQMPKKNEYVPMFWGAKSWGKWNDRKAYMKSHKPQHLLGFNEPDVSGQADMSPSYAVQVWMQEIHPWGKKGVKLGGPAIVWNINWLDSFLKELKEKGGYVDFLQIHWYGSWKDLAKFKSYVQTVHSKFGKDIWVTELGITTASHPSQAQARQFMIDAYDFMDSTGYVQRASWFGCFPEDNPPDNYATGKNALFTTGDHLSTLGVWYGTGSTSSRRSLQIRHAEIARIAARADEEAEDPDAEHCDDLCKLREEQVNEYLSNNPEEREVGEAEIEA